MNQGRCLCGTVRFEVTAPVAALAHCHCSMCRKHHGTAFVTWAVVPAAALRITAGTDNIRRYASSAAGHRAFCATCGSVVPEIAPGGAYAVIPAGNIEGDLGLEPQFHMFVGSKAAWYQITDDLPQHAEFPPAFARPAEPRPAVPVRAGTTGGSCLCGAVAYEITGPPLRFMYCHCSRCRLARGAAHATNIFYRADDFTWTRGADLVVDYPLPGAQRFAVAFCRTCGSALPRIATTANLVNVPAGSLDTQPAMEPEAHIFVASRASWETITGSLPQFAGMPTLS